jgi:hypothetical protein
MPLLAIDDLADGVTGLDGLGLTGEDVQSGSGNFLLRDVLGGNRACQSRGDS